MLADRKKKILTAIVESFLSTGEPVGSKTLMNLEGLNCSSATIRNDMADLVELGLLAQPHTSAGRIPSQMGYDHGGYSADACAFGPGTGEKLAREYVYMLYELYHPEN